MGNIGIMHEQQKPYLLIQYAYIFVIYFYKLSRRSAARNCLYPPLVTSMNVAAAIPPCPLRPPLCGRTAVECHMTHVSHALGQTP